MINNARPNISQYPEDVPDAVAAGGNRVISATPIYKATEILALAEGKNVSLWSKGSRRDAAKWCLDISDLSELIASALQNGRFLGAEWCQQGHDGPWAACDAWAVTRREWIENTRKHMEHYLLPQIRDFTHRHHLADGLKPSGVHLT